MSKGFSKNDAELSELIRESDSSLAASGAMIVQIKEDIRRIKEKSKEIDEKISVLL